MRSFNFVGVPAVIVVLVASIRPSTFDMAESETTEISCGALNLTATKQRTRYDCSILIGVIHRFHMGDQVFPNFRLIEKKDHA